MWILTEFFLCLEVKKLQLTEVTNTLLDLLAEGATMQTIVDKSSEILQNPVMVFDNRLRVAMTSDKHPVNISLWHQTLKERYITSEMISSMEDHKIIENLKTKREANIYKMPNGYLALRVPLFYRDKYCGFIGTYNYFSEFSLDDADRLTVISKAICSLLYTESDLTFLNEDDSDAYLHQLLEIESTEEATLVSRRHSSINFQGEKLIVTVSRKQTKNAPWGRHEELLRKQFVNSYSTVFDDHLVLLIILKHETDNNVNTVINYLKNYCQRNRLIAGVSTVFSKIDFIPLAYQQAVFAKRLVAKDDVYQFQNHLLELVIETCLGEHPAPFYRHPLIKKIQSYDQTYSTEYLTTLRTYLLCSSKLKVTADTLNIHYSTLKYRMSAIERIIGEAFKTDNQLKLTLLLSILIVENKRQ